MASVDLLSRELYDLPEASRVAHVPASTLWWWLEGGVRAGRDYEPVLRAARSGSRLVTWGELVEARLLRAYRDRGVKLAKLRGFIDELRTKLGIPYPLAHSRPWIGPGRELILAAQESAGLPAELWLLYSPGTGQQMITGIGQRFLDEVEFEDDESSDEYGAVVRLHPAGRSSPVVIDPKVRYGVPHVHGVPTYALVDMVDAGDAIETVAADFDLSVDDVVAVLAYERGTADLAA